MVELKKRFALFLAALDSDFVKKTYGGYFHVFVSTFGDEGERWDLFRVINGEFPDEKDLDKYDGFVISGSPHDAFGDADWIVKICSVCHKLDEMKKKVLGICFGHQQEFADKARSTMETAQPDRNQRQKICKNFLKG